MQIILYRSCPACGNFAGYAGTLGNCAHYNCSHCGTWFHTEVEYEDDEEDYEGFEGQDRENYTDTQDRENYLTEEV